MSLWCIWTWRNEALWKQIAKPPNISFDAVMNYHSQWQAARTTTCSNQTPPALDQVIKWSPPRQNYIKCILDVALLANDNKFSLGVCFRNSLGEFLETKTTWFYGIPSVLEAECGNYMKQFSHPFSCN